MKRVFIIHGWGASPDANWFPWLYRELEEKGFNVIVPAMPNTENPDFDEWQDALKKIITNPDEDTYLVGHSLGVITVLKFLESLESGQEIGGAFLVAGYSDATGYEKREEFRVLKSFFKIDIDYEKIKKACKYFLAIHSDDDPYIPLEKGEIIKKELGAELIIMKKMGHITDCGGSFRLPILLEKILKILK